MKDREFIELLNLYIDHEISPEDAHRLEAEVMSRPDRREVYTQYCRMQKACSMLSERFGEEAPARAEAAPRSVWGFGPALAGLAAACMLVAVGLRMGGILSKGAAEHAAAPVRAAAVAATVTPAANPDAMQPVFLTRALAPQAAPRASASVLVSYAPLQQTPQLNWIAAVQLTPVSTSASPDIRLAPRTDLKATMLSDAQGSRDSQQPGEMAAFRFQR